MATTVVVIAQGEMGAGIGSRLHAQGARVLTSLAGRSKASAERAAKAGMEPVSDDARLVAEADFLMSVIPPGEAVPFARRFAPHLAKSAKKPSSSNATPSAPRASRRSRRSSRRLARPSSMAASSAGRPRPTGSAAASMSPGPRRSARSS